MRISSATSPWRWRAVDSVPSLPILAWVPTYRRSWLRYDLIAGLTVWALVVPQAIAYAQIAGLPPQAGVFASFAAPLGYALFGTSRQLIVSPTSATAAISAALVAPLVVGDVGRYADLSAALAITSGIVFLLLGWWKMGFVSQFIATGVQVGFLFGLGLTIIIGQVMKLLGISGASGPFVEQFWYLLRHLDDAHGWTAVLGVGSLAAMLAFKRVAPGVPAALLVVAVGIVLVALFDLDGHGVAVVGQVDRAVPLPSVPRIEFDDLVTLVPGALAIALIGYSETISVAEQFADEHRYEIRPNQELAALGVSGIAAGLFQGFIAGGGASQSAANDRAGARTQLAGVVLAVLAALTAVALLPLFRDLPLAVLGAIVISAVIGFLNVAELRRVLRLRRDSFVLAMVALAGVLVLDVLPGLLIAVALSILLMLGHVSRPSASVLGNLRGTRAYVDAERTPEAEQVPGLLIFRLDAPLIFINATWMRDSLRRRVADAQPPPRVIVVDLRFTPELDIKSLDVLARLAADVRETGAELWLADVRAPVRDMLRRGEAMDAIGESRVFLTVEEAVAAYREG